jgi:hypothetical protein
MLGLRTALAIALAAGAIGASPGPCQSRPDKPPEKPAEALYLQLGQVGLDPAQVYQVRGASLDRAAIHITLEDGTIAFTQDVMGRITGAFFEGDGEVLLPPPNDVERRSMSLFTGMAILEQHFATAYFRFNDDAATELRPDLRGTDNQQEFVDRWNPTAKNLANSDAMRLLITFSRMLPQMGKGLPADSAQADVRDRFFHARLQGAPLGVFDVNFDSLLLEQIQAGQAKPAKDGNTYYDVWTSFALPATTGVKPEANPALPKEIAELQDWVVIRRYTIKTEVQPPKQIHARAQLQLEARENGRRMLLFELSRFLQVESVTLDGQPVEFIHNPAMEGTQLSRRGNDVVAVILPEPTKKGQKFDLEFVYGGEVLAEAGGGLLYVGARGAWYPNRGMAMADYDLEFEYPQEWTLVATGKPMPVSPATDSSKTKREQASHWVSERPIPLAGFNLGKYRIATARAGEVKVETYAAQGVERDFPSAAIHLIEPQPSDPTAPLPPVDIPYTPSPARNEESVAQSAAHAVDYFAARFGPYPYGRLALTQMPGRESQGWPGLVFLSSYAFLSKQEREQMHYGPTRILLQQLIPAHETAHQWWGDLISWETYRDQWFSEGLANYSALMMLQEKDPVGFRQIMEEYRRDLVTPDKDGMAPKDAGPVTLGGRLESSRFPGGYDAISYGRATWLFHMLRTMLDDASGSTGHKGGPDQPFVRALRHLRERYAGRSITTHELLDLFAENLPPALRYEGKNSLDWFLNGWVNGTSLPKLQLRAVKFNPRDAGLVVTGTILQKDAPQDLVTSVPLYGVISGKQPVFLGRVFADGEESSFRLNSPAGVHKILLDPEQTILTSPK